MWDVELKLAEDGGDMFQWDPVTKTKKSIGTKSYHRLMCNYFSIGVESRIGLGFEKLRTNSAFCNKTCYVWEGFKKMCCVTNTPKIRDVVDYVTHGPKDNE